MRVFRCINFVSCWLVLAMINRFMFSEAFSSLAFANPRKVVRESHLRASEKDVDKNSSPRPSVSRRKALGEVAWIIPSIATAGAFLSYPQSASAVLVPSSDTKQAIVITGCNSGIGLDAATRLAKRGHKVVLACRALDKAETAANDIRKSVDMETVDLIPAECDLGSMESIASFVEKLKEVLGADGKIDVLALNAGVARNTAAKDVLRTKEGFELTGERITESIK